MQSKTLIDKNRTQKITQEAAILGALRKRYSENMQQIYRRRPMPKYDFNKVTKQLY